MTNRLQQLTATTEKKVQNVKLDVHKIIFECLLIVPCLLLLSVFLQVCKEFLARNQKTLFIDNRLVLFSCIPPSCFIPKQKINSLNLTFFHDCL